MSSISPQGYKYGNTPSSVHPFWDDSTYITDLTASAEVDDATGTPDVELSVTKTDGVGNLHFAFTGLKGENGSDGEDGTTPDIDVSATVDDTTGTPSVSVTKSGTLDEPVFTLAFTGLKGETGATGATGAQGETGADGEDGVTPDITVAATVDGTTGTPSVSVTKSGTTAEPIFTLAFTGLKGESASGDITTVTTSASISSASDMLTFINGIIATMTAGQTVVVPMTMSISSSYATNWAEFYVRYTNRYNDTSVTSINYYGLTGQRATSSEYACDSSGGIAMSGLCTLKESFYLSDWEQRIYCEDGIISYDMLSKLQKNDNTKIWLLITLDSDGNSSFRFMNNLVDEDLDLPSRIYTMVGSVYNLSGSLTTGIGERIVSYARGGYYDDTGAHIDGYAATYCPPSKPNCLGMNIYIRDSGDVRVWARYKAFISSTIYSTCKSQLLYTHPPTYQDSGASNGVNCILTYSATSDASYTTDKYVTNPFAGGRSLFSSSYAPTFTASYYYLEG